MLMKSKYVIKNVGVSSWGVFIMHVCIYLRAQGHRGLFPLSVFLNSNQ